MSDPGSGLDPETAALFDRLAGKVVDTRMSVPAILFLESMKPMNFVGAQALGFFEPLLRTLFPWNDLERLRAAFENRDNIEVLLVKIEEKEAARTSPPRKDRT